MMMISTPFGPTFAIGTHMTATTSASSFSHSKEKDSVPIILKHEEKKRTNPGKTRQVNNHVLYLAEDASSHSVVVVLVCRVRASLLPRSTWHF